MSALHWLISCRNSGGLNGHVSRRCASGLNVGTWGWAHESRGNDSLQWEINKGFIKEGGFISALSSFIIQHSVATVDHKHKKMKMKRERWSVTVLPPDSW